MKTAVSYIRIMKTTQYIFLYVCIGIKLSDMDRMHTYYCSNSMYYIVKIYDMYRVSQVSNCNNDSM